MGQGGHGPTEFAILSVIPVIPSNFRTFGRWVVLIYLDSSPDSTSSQPYFTFSWLLSHQSCGTNKTDERTGETFMGMDQNDDHPSQRCSMYRTLQPYKPLFRPPVHLRMIVENPNNFAPIISDAPLPLPLVSLAVALASKKVLPSIVLKFLYSYNMLQHVTMFRKNQKDSFFLTATKTVPPIPKTSSTQQTEILQCQVEQHGLLTHEANLLPPPTHVQHLQVSSPHCDETLLRIIKPQQNLSWGFFGGESRWAGWEPDDHFPTSLSEVHMFRSDLNVMWIFDDFE